jgi:hypothetical protein
MPLPSGKLVWLVEIWLVVAPALQPSLPAGAMLLAASQGHLHDMNWIIRNDRLFGLAPLDWSVLLVGSMLCGFLTFF